MNKTIAQLLFTVLMFLFFSYTAWEAMTFKKLARHFPFYISLLGVFAMLIEIIRQIIQLKKSTDTEPLHPNIKAVLKYTFILVMYIILVYIIGLIIASVIYLFLFLYLIAKMEIKRVILSVILLVIIVISFGNMMNLYWPKSLFNLLTIIPL